MKVNQIKAGAILSYLSMGLSTIISLVYTPIMLQRLGESEFGDTDEIERMHDEVEKRRFIDSLVQGASYIYSEAKWAYEDDIDSLDDRLIPIYDKIRALNDYLLFTKKETITDETPSGMPSE